MPAQTSTMEITATSLEITRNPVANNVADIIPFAHNTNVTGVFNQKPLSAQPGEWHYKYDSQTILCIRTAEGIDMSIELQDVSTFIGFAGTYNGGTLSDLQDCIADIQAQIP